MNEATMTQSTRAATDSDAWYTLGAADGLDRMRESEWLLVDGLGGFAMGNAAGINDRRYHGWLIAGVKPPLGRVMALNGLVERLVVHADTGNGAADEIFELSSFAFENDLVHPNGVDFLERFEKGLEFVRWTYRLPTRAGQAVVTRELRTRWQLGGVMVCWRLEGLDDAESTLELRPLVRLCDFHYLGRQHPDSHRVQVGEGGVIVEGPHAAVHLAVDHGDFEPAPDWWLRFSYIREAERALDAIEDLFTPGVFRHRFDPGGGREQVLRAGLRMEQVVGRLEVGLRAAQIESIRHGASETAPSLAGRPILLAAGDDFVVPRVVGADYLVSIIAGYPWFGDWGRDTMISLPGLLLVTRRFDEALGTLRAFASHRRRGLIPNLFDETGEGAAYNTVDASLWFIHTCCEYLNWSGDRDGFDRYLRDACLDIVAHYRAGTDFGIRMDPEDGLIISGEEGWQLTWMDAKRDGTVFTPRAGKPVEIAALWHHGLRSLVEALGPDDAVARDLEALADLVAESFAKFWCDSSDCLADVLNPVDGGWVQDHSIRPNQLFAVSLRHSPLSREWQRSVVAVCERELLTPMGLRTLSPRDPKYRGRFVGSMYERDGAYHQGTVWPWLIGPFVEALLRSEEFSEAAKAKARATLEPLLDSMNPGGKWWGRTLGQICEVYDGDDAPDRPRQPGGCIAQAWSVAELTRCLVLVEGRGR